MDKKTQDLAWAYLPKEAREFIKNDTATAWQLAYARVFGHHNLTSDTEPEEMLMVERKKAIDYHNAVTISCEKSQNIDEYTSGKFQGICTTLYELFGDKCLPDRETCKKNLQVEQPSVQGEPKFHKGDLVKCITDGQIYEVEGKTGKHYYALKGSCYDAHEDNLEPYTEPEAKEFIASKPEAKGEAKDTMCEHRNLSQETANCDKPEDNQLKDNMEANFVRLANEPESTVKGVQTSATTDIEENPISDPDIDYDEVMQKRIKDMEEKELNLCELLKGCEGEEFYSNAYGEVTFVDFIKHSIHGDLIYIKWHEYEEYYCDAYLFPNGRESSKGMCILWPSKELYQKYPLDPKKAWKVWAEARKSKRWRAEKDEYFYLITTGGEVGSVQDTYSDYYNDLYKLGNYFRTKEEAQQAAEAVKETLEKFHEKNNEE